MYRMVAAHALVLARSNTRCSRRAGQRVAGAESRRADIVDDVLLPRRRGRMFGGLETSLPCPDAVYLKRPARR